jgi:death-on-curing protein
MPEVDFLELSDVMQIHANQTALYGGACEIRDVNLLESAIEQPRASFDGVYLHAFPFEMAAAYLFHIVMNHPFVDGNKRTGTAAALVFLDINGISIEAKSGELSDLTLAVSMGSAGKREISQFFESHQSN